MGHPLRSGTPPLAYFVAAVCLAAPALGSAILVGENAAYPLAIWLLALVPVALFAYYDGWEGVALALALTALVGGLSLGFGILPGRGIVDWARFTDFILAFMVAATGLGVLAWALHRDLGTMADRERSLTLQDARTGLPSERFTAPFLENAFARAQRGEPVTLVLFSIDRLEDYARYHGPGAVDAALGVFGRALRKTTRRMEFSGHHGGGRFASVLAPAAEEDALKFVERVRAALLEADLPLTGRVSASAGVAAVKRGMRSPGELLGAAEAALDEAQRGGRDRVVVHRPPEPEAGVQVGGEDAGGPDAVAAVRSSPRL